MNALVNDSTSALLRAIRARLAGAAEFRLEEIRSRAWASVTFVGARHTLAFRLTGEEAERAADAFLKDLDVAELALRGHILADIVLLGRESGEDGVTIRLEALTVEDA